MTDFIETPRFPDDIAYGSQMGFGFNTWITTLSSGFEARDSRWLDALGSFMVEGINMTEAQKATLINFFRTVKGRAIGFRIRDWADYTVDSSSGRLGTADTAPGAVTVFQMSKKYAWGAESNFRVIAKPTSAAIYKNSVLQTLTTDYTIDLTTGLVTFVVAPTLGDTLHWVGEFDVPARFDVDEIKATVVNKSGGAWIWNFGAVPIRELRL